MTPEELEQEYLAFLIKQDIPVREIREAYRQFNERHSESNEIERMRELLFKVDSLAWLDLFISLIACIAAIVAIVLSLR